MRTEAGGKREKMCERWDWRLESAIAFVWQHGDGLTLLTLKLARLDPDARAIGTPLSC